MGSGNLTLSTCQAGSCHPDPVRFPATDPTSTKADMTAAHGRQAFFQNQVPGRRHVDIFLSYEPPALGSPTTSTTAVVRLGSSSWRGILFSTKTFSPQQELQTWTHSRQLNPPIAKIPRARNKPHPSSNLACHILPQPASKKTTHIEWQANKKKFDVNWARMRGSGGRVSGRPTEGPTGRSLPAPH